MARITPPATFLARLREADLQLDRVDFEMRGSYNPAARQVLAWATGHAWALDLSLHDMTDNEGRREFEAFLMLLRGRVNTFAVPYPGYSGPSTGYAGVKGKVDGAGQTGFSILAKGYPNSTALYGVGDKVTIGDELKVITSAISSNGSGAATLLFEPAIRISPANNSDIEHAAPFVVLAADDSGVARWGLRPGKLSTFPTFRAVETLET